MPVWMQNIFEVLEKYSGFAKYIGFGELLGVRMQQTF